MTKPVLLAVAFAAAIAASACGRKPETPPPAIAAPSSAGGTSTTGQPDSLTGVLNQPLQGASAPGTASVPTGPAAGGDPSRTGLGSGTEVGGLQGQAAGGGPGGPNQSPVSGNTAAVPKP